MSEFFDKLKDLEHSVAKREAVAELIDSGDDNPSTEKMYRFFHNIVTKNIYSLARIIWVEIPEELTHYKNKIKQLENLTEKFKDQLVTHIRLTAIDKKTLGTNFEKIYVQQNPSSVTLDDPGSIPLKFKFHRLTVSGKIAAEDYDTQKKVEDFISSMANHSNFKFEFALETDISLLKSYKKQNPDEIIPGATVESTGFHLRQNIFKNETRILDV